MGLDERGVRFDRSVDGGQVTLGGHAPATGPDLRVAPLYAYDVLHEEDGLVEALARLGEQKRETLAWAGEEVVPDLGPDVFGKADHGHQLISESRLVTP